MPRPVPQCCPPPMTPASRWVVMHRVIKRRGGGCDVSVVNVATDRKRARSEARPEQACLTQTMHTGAPQAPGPLTRAVWAWKALRVLSPAPRPYPSRLLLCWCTTPLRCSPFPSVCTALRVQTALNWHPPRKHPGYPFQAPCTAACACGAR